MMVGHGSMRYRRFDWVDVFIGAIIIFAVVLMLLTVFTLFQHVTGIKKGVIYDKDYDPAYTTFIYSNKTMVPQYHRESWQLYFKDGVGNTNWIEVDETTYHEYDIGDYWDGE